MEQAVVEGTGTSDLRKGPGHYSATPLPGHAGNSGIAGHRTTYGAPFHRLDELEVGDEITVRTREGRFRYVVAGHEIVKPSQVEVLLPKGDNRLTLTTCHPKYRAVQRYIVWATLHPDDHPVGAQTAMGDSDSETGIRAETKLASSDEEGTTTPSTLTPVVPGGSGVSPVVIAAEDTGTAFQFGALPPALFWSAAIGAGLRLTRPWRLSRYRYASMALVSPVFAFCLLQSFRSVSHFLPANF